ncbi:hypothetical protein MMC10_002538 [Thelotrema lepadinum]|nr:hypothetical protein [Thelotrema lepadinum]
MGVIQRMRDLNTLLNIRLGPGAAVLPKDVKRLHLEFAQKSRDGHLGSRKFWRDFLPRLKYHNPAVSMTVERNLNQEGPATMTVFFTPETEPLANSSDSVDNSLINEKLQTIDMRFRDQSEILAELLKITKGMEVQVTEEDKLQLQESQQLQSSTEQDRIRSRLDHEARMREKRLLEQARQAVGGVRM